MVDISQVLYSVKKGVEVYKNWKKNTGGYTAILKDQDQKMHCFTRKIYETRRGFLLLWRRVLRFMSGKLLFNFFIVTGKALQWLQR